MAKYNGKANMIPTNRRSKTEAKEISRKGGIKSGEARRAKRDIKKLAQAVLDMRLPNSGYDSPRDALKAAGVPDADITYRLAIIMHAAQMSMEQKGEKWAKLLADMSGEMPESRVSVEADIAEAPQVHIFIPDNGRDGLTDGGAEK